MNDSNTLDTPSEPATDFYVPDEDNIRLLQTILEGKCGKHIPFEEAEEVGVALIALYECLARDRTILPRTQDEQF